MRLGERLLRQRRVDQRTLSRALDLQKQLGGRLATNLLELGVVDEETLLKEIGIQRGVRTAPKDRFANIDSRVIRVLPAKIAHRYSIVPFAIEGRTLLIAGMDPVAAINEDEIAFLTSYAVRSHIALELRVELALARYYRAPSSARFGILVKRLALSRSAAEDSGSSEPDESSGRAQPSAAAEVDSRSRIPVSLTADGARELARVKEAKKKATASKPRFIELDDEDLALLEAEESRPPETVVSEASDISSDPASQPPDFEAAADGSAVEPVTEKTLAMRLNEATASLVACEIRDEISDAILGFSASIFKTSVLLIKRRRQIVGWHGVWDGDRGEAQSEKLQSFELAAEAPSIFRELDQAGSKWHGPLPPLPSNRAFETMLGETRVEECVVLPIAVRSKVVGYFFGESPIGDVPLEELERLMRKAGIAFEVYILKNKLRLL